MERDEIIAILEKEIKFCKSMLDDTDYYRAYVEGIRFAMSYFNKESKNDN